MLLTHGRFLVRRRGRRLDWTVGSLAKAGRGPLDATPLVGFHTGISCMKAADSAPRDIVNSNVIER